MTSPVRPEEISALLDGELPPGRAEEVRRALAEDHSLREVYRQLVAVDGDLTAYAADCQFSPRLSMAGRLSMEGRRPMPDRSIAAVACGLLAVRVLAKLLLLPLGIGLQLAVLALLVGWLVWRLLPGLLENGWLVDDELRAHSASGRHELPSPLPDAW